MCHDFLWCWGNTGCLGTYAAVWQTAIILAATIAAIVQIRQNNNTRALTAALQLLAEYSSEDMAKAMRGLFEWQENHPKDFVPLYVDLLRRRAPEGYDIDDHRRYVYRYFHKIRLLSEAKLIEQQTITRTIHNNPTVFRLLNEILQPLDKGYRTLREYKDNPDTTDTFTYYQRQYTGQE